MRLSLPTLALQLAVASKPKLLEILGNKVSIVDIAIFPFVRQFANVDRDWFDAQDLKQLQDWLQGHVESALFIKVFAKQSENPYLLF